MTATVFTVVMYELTIPELLLPQPPFVSQTEDVFSACWWEVYGKQPNTRGEKMELACDDIRVACCQVWIRHTRGSRPEAVFYFISVWMNLENH